MDVTFSKGFVGCFENDDIVRILSEQRRISRNYVVATVHNAHNPGFKEYFNKRAELDLLYSLRFFFVEEINELFQSAGLVPEVFSVGKAYQSGGDLLIREGASLVEVAKFIKSSGLQGIKSSEYLMVAARP